jgi:hypothetical protein
MIDRGLTLVRRSLVVAFYGGGSDGMGINRRLHCREPQHRDQHWQDLCEPKTGLDETRPITSGLK